MRARWQSKIAIVAVGAASAFALQACFIPTPPNFLCDNDTPGPSPSASSAAPAAGDSQDPSAPKVVADFNVNLSVIWKTTTIPVCWEDQAIQQTSSNDRAIVQQAVSDSWETAFSAVALPSGTPVVTFTGWDACSSDPVASATGIRITTTTGDPMCLGLGTQLAGLPNGMQLNFTFDTWSTGCSLINDGRQHCIYAIAVHEFGHALGLAHEQNRSDTPQNCLNDYPAQGENGSVYLGAWDPDSVMNYCNVNWNNSGILSSNDASGIRTIYYPAAAKAFCGYEVVPGTAPGASSGPGAGSSSSAAGASSSSGERTQQ